VRRIGRGEKRRRATAILAAAQDNRCALCGHAFTPDRPATIDHIVPCSEGPRFLNNLSNLQAAHALCNHIRSNMPLDEFRRAVADGRIELPDADGYRNRPSRRARRGLARLRAEIAFDVTNPSSVWRGNPRNESKPERNARLRDEVDAALRSE
jgi:hypothetical protein